MEIFWISNAIYINNTHSISCSYIVIPTGWPKLIQDDYYVIYIFAQDVKNWDIRMYVLLLIKLSVNLEVMLCILLLSLEIVNAFSYSGSKNMLSSQFPLGVIFGCGCLIYVWEVSILKFLNFLPESQCMIVLNIKTSLHNFVFHCIECDLNCANFTFHKKLNTS